MLPPILPDLNFNLTVKHCAVSCGAHTVERCEDCTAELSTALLAIVGQQLCKGDCTWGQGRCGPATAPTQGGPISSKGECAMEEGACVPLEPAVAEWSPWGEWGSCSQTCGEGRRGRVRRCTTNNPTCPGEDSQTEGCSLQPCKGQLVCL